jgi:mono/diheme cytochrome c family protein
MRRQGVQQSLSIALLLGFVTACGGGDVALPTLTPPLIGDSSGLVARGEYIVRSVSVCGQCHSSEQGNSDGPLSGGSEFKNWRLGTIRAANLTPDPETGLGRWTDAEIVRAIRSGEDRKGKLLAPTMPYEWLHGMSDHDALAVARYLKSLPPVRNAVDSDPNLILHAAKLFFLRVEDEPIERAPPRGPTAAYGRYLANHVSICAECHTPHGGLQQKADLHKLFAGDATPWSGWPANPTNITSDSTTGIGRWTEEEFLQTLRTGVNPQGDSLHSFMPRELGRMTDDDLRAIYRYLQTVPPIRNQVPRTKARRSNG